MKVEVKNLGKGHYKITAEIDNEELSCITTNTLAIDCLGEDEIYFIEDNRYYGSSEEAEQALLDEIKIKN